MRKADLQYIPPQLEFTEKEMRNIYGIDYASKNDYFAVVLNQLPPYDDRMKYVPRLKTMRQFTKQSYDKTLEMLEQEMFVRWPPYYIVADYTNEKTFTDLLIRDYGKDIVEPINFTISSKQMLKDDGLSILIQGYEFPNPAQVKHPRIREWITKCMDQLQAEQVIMTPSNKISFDHPPGEHNDLSTAWELSIHGCLRFSIRPYSSAVIASSKGKRSPRSIYKRPQDYVPELSKNPHNRLKGVSVSSS